MATTAFDTGNYNVSTNPDGTLAKVLINEVLTEIQSGGSQLANVNPGGNLVYRLHKVPNPAEPGNSSKGALPAVSRMRWLNANNTGANTSGNTSIADAGRQIDTQFFKLEKVRVADNVVVETIPCTATQVNGPGALPAYTDITFNPVPSGSSANELDRDVAYFYRATLVPNLPYTAYEDGPSPE